MLPTFPKAQKELDAAFHKEMLECKEKLFPLHFQPPIHHIVEGKTSDFQREDRQVKQMKMQKHSFEASFHAENGKGMTLATFHEKAKEIGDAIGKKMFQTVLGVVDEAVKETGNEVKIKRGAFAKEDFLKMLEMIQHNFDEYGKPTAQLVCGPEFAEELKQRDVEWRGDKEFVAKVNEITNRKREEFHEREARRRLVD
jgi:hypothetical protein